MNDDDGTSGGCEGCPYDPDCESYKKWDEALHYLKQLQKIEDEYEELKDWWAEEHAENVPLSWDELKQMDGKPVWWVHGEVGEWLTIYCVPIILNDSVLYATTCSGVECWIYKKDMDKYQYFRKERK